MTRKQSHDGVDQPGTPGPGQTSGTRIPKAIALPSTVVLGLTLLLALIFALSGVGRARAAGGLTVEILAGYNLVVDSNVSSPSSYGPSAATVAARICNTSTQPISDVVIHIGNYSALTPGIYPSRSTLDASFATEHPALVDGGGTYAFTHVGGSLGLGDATRQGGVLQPGQCTVQYWTFEYPRCENVGGLPDEPPCTNDPVWGDSVKPEDDLWLTFDVWATGFDGASTITTAESWKMTMRNEISAMANKIEPNGNPSGEWFNTDTNNVQPGSVITTNGILYRIGNVQFGFDNDGDYLPDYNFWVQPIGDAGQFDPGCFRLIRTSGVITIEGSTPTVINFTDQLYFSQPQVPDDNTNVIGEVFYTFMALGSNCASTPTPYQEAASGHDNEKFNADYGAGGPPGMTNEASLVGVDKTSNPDLIGVGQIITYRIPFVNSGTEPAGLTLYQGAYVNNPLVISDTIPQGAIYSTGSATYTLSTGGDVTIRYSTDNGQTWSDSEPASGVTTIQWWLQEPLPSGAWGEAYFSVIIPLTYTGGPVIENCVDAQFDSGVSITDACKLVVVQGPYTIGNEVWIDLNRDAIIDAGEPYLGDVTVSLYYDRNGDGQLDSQDLLVSTITSSSRITDTGFYTFTDLYTGTYLVQVDRTDPDIPLGYRASTPTVYAVSLSSAQPSYLDADFGFGPSLEVEKTIPGGACYAGREATFNVTVRNILGSGGEPSGSGCSYYVWAADAVALVGAEKPWFNPSNAYGADGPDGMFAYSTWANASDWLKGTGFDISSKGTISSVEVIAWMYQSQSPIVDDFMHIAVYSSTGTIVETQDPPATPSHFTTVFNNYAGASNQGYFSWDVTSARNWSWADFASGSGLELGFETQKDGGKDYARLDVDAFGFRITTQEACPAVDPADIMTVIPLVDSYDTTSLLQFLSTDPNYSDLFTAASTGVITWSNVGPLAPGESAQIQITYLLSDVTSATPITNAVLAGDGGTFIDGGATHTATDVATCTIQPTHYISGVVWSDGSGGTNDWVGTVGYEGVDTFIPDVQVNLYICEGVDTAASPAKACTDSSNGGQWVLFESQTTDANGHYLFDHVPEAYYYIEVDTSSFVAPPTTTGDPDEGPQPPGCDTGGSSACDVDDNLWRHPDAALGGTNQISKLISDTIDINFGYVMDAAIYGTVWEDFDGDGIRDADDVGLDNSLAGITVTLMYNGVVISTTQTDASGYYVFPGLTMTGVYTITVDESTLPAPASQWTLTDDPDHATPLSNVYTLTLGSGEISGSHDFGYHRSGTYSLGDRVYADWNGNGTQDTGEEGLNGITVYLYDAAGGGLISTTTTTTGPGGVTGYYTFTNLPTNTYRIVVDEGDLPSWWPTYEQTQDPDEAGVCSTCDGQATAVLSSTQPSLDTIDFGYRPFGGSSIGDYVWYDQDGDGVPDLGESGLAGITVNLYWDTDGNGVLDPAADALITTTTTDADGYYLFTGLVSGTYLVQVDTSTPSFPTDAFGNPYYLTTSGNPLTVALGNNETYLDADFGFTQPGAVGDFVWQDINGDANQDPGEPGIPGVGVTLYLDTDGDGYGDTAWLTTTTDASGYYSFTGVPSGTYVVVVNPDDLPAGYVQTSDPESIYPSGICEDGGYAFDDCNGESNFDLRWGQIDMTHDFGYKPPRAIGDFVWLDYNGDGVQDPNEPGIPGVVISLTIPSDGTITTTTDIGGYYLFGSDVLVVTGTYTVEVFTATLPITLAETYDKDGGLDSLTLVNITATTYLTDVDFGYRYAGPYQITGTVFFDIGGTSDGLTDTFTSGDIPYSGITVYLYDDSGSQIGITTTDASGHFTFTNLYGGGLTYTVSVDRFAPELISSTLTASPDGANHYNTVVITDRDIGYQDFGFYEAIPVLTVTKTVSPTGPVEPGQVLTYSIVISNSGSVTATTVAISDTIPDNTTYVSSSLDIVPPTAGTTNEPTGGLIYLEPLTVAANSLITITFQVTVVNPIPGGVDTITNTVVMTGPGPGGTVITHTDSVTVAVVTPTIAILKWTTTPTVEAGSAVTFTILVTNTGDVPLVPVTVTDALVPGCDTVIPAGLGVGVTATYQCSITNVTAAFTNTAVVSGTSPAGTVVTDTDTAPVSVVTPSVAIEKLPDNQVVETGSTVTFTIVVTNTGDVPLVPGTVTDALVPDCDTVIPAGLGVGLTTTYQCSITNVTAAFTNTAVVSGTSPAGTTVTDTDDALVTVITPSVAIEKLPDNQVVETGGTVTFTIVVTNTGDVPLVPVTVTDALVPDCDTVIPAGLGVGVTATYQCSITNVTAAFTNTAVVSGTSPAGTVVTDTDTAPVSVVTPSIAIEKLPDNQVVETGGTVTFTIVVTNTGDVPLVPVTVTDALVPDCDTVIPAGLGVGVTATYQCSITNVTAAFTNTAVVSGTSPAGTVVTDTDTAPVSVVTPSIAIEKLPDNQVVETGGTVTFTIVVTNTGDVPLVPGTVTDALVPDCDTVIPAGLGVGLTTTYQCSITNVTAAFTNTAVVSGTSPAGTVVTDTDTAPVSVVTPSITIAKTPDYQVVEAGGTVTFTIAVTNTGTVTLTNVVISDTPYASCDWSVPIMPVGDVQTNTCVVSPVTGDFTNTVVVTGTSPAGTTVTDTDDAVVTVITPSITIAKTPDTQVVEAGGTVTFTIAVTNTGTVTLTNVVISDTPYASCDWVVGDMPVGDVQTNTCVVSPVTGDFTNTVVVTGTSPAGTTVTDTDDAVVTVITPSIAIAKTPDTQVVEAGGTVTFTIAVTNTGTVTLTGVVISDTPYASCDWVVGDMPVGDVQTNTCVVSPVTGDFTNTVVVTGTSPAGTTVTDTDDAVVTVITPSITIAKTPDTQVVEAGGTVTFTIAVTNTGTVTLTGVVISDTPYASCDWVVGDMPVGDVQTNTCVVSPVTGDFTNTVVVTGTSPAGTTVTDTDDAVVTVITPSITIAKTPDYQVVEAGGTVTFTIAVTNTGTVTLTGVVISDTPYASCDWVVGDMPVGDVQTNTCVVSPVTGDFTNTVVVTGTSPAGTTVTDTDDAFVSVITPSIAIAKTPDYQVVEAGGTVTFTIVVTNTGDVPLVPVTVTDALVPDCDTVIPAGLGVGLTTTYQCSITNVTADFTNTVNVSGTSPVGTVVTDTDDAVVTVITPSIVIEKLPDNQVAEAGGTVTFTIVVTNTGDVPLVPVTVTDALVPDCDAVIPAGLGVGVTATYQCSITNVTAAFTNTAVVSGTSPLGTVVTDTDTAPVSVVTPSVAIEKLPDTQVVEAGGTVTFTIAVTNTGTVTLTNVVISDTPYASCDWVVGDMPVGDVQTNTCVVSPVTGDFTNTVVVTGTSPAGTTVTDTDDAVVTVITPSIAIAKTPDYQVVEAGGTVTFTIAVTNTGTVTLTGVVISDTPYASCDWVVGDMPVGDVQTNTCVVSPVTGDFTNTVVVTGTSPIGTVVTDTDDALVTVITPSITIAKTPDYQVVEAGGTVTFTIAVTNTGTVTLTGVVISDTPYASCDWVVGDMPVGDVQTNTCVVSPVTGDFTNTVVVTGTSPAGTTVTDTDDALVTVITPSIAIAKTPDTQVVEAGGTVTFTIAVTNTGTVTLTGVVISDTPYASCDWVVGDMPVGDVQTNTCVVNNVTADFTNTVVVTGTTPGGIVVTDTDDALVTVLTPGISIAKTPDNQSVLIGGTVTFTIIVTNTGQVPLDPVVITDVVAPACVQVISPLTIGEVYSYTCTQPNVTADFVNTVVVTGTSPVGTTVTDTDDARVTVIDPSLAITKTLVTIDPVQVGDPVQFVIVVQNTGNITLTTAPLTDTYDTAYLTYVSASPPSNDNVNDGVINWANVGPIAPGASVPIAVNFIAAGSTQVLPGLVTTNTATVSATDAAGNDLPPDSDDDVVEIYNPGIVVVKTVSPGTVVPNQLVTYTISITNTGDVPLLPFVITDTLDPGLTYQSANPLPSSVVGQQVVWSVTSGLPLPPGGSTQFTLVVRVTGPAGSYDNYVTAAGDHPRGVVTDTDQVPVFVIDPTLAVAKDIAPPGGAVGGIITFTIHVTNTGPSTLDVVPLVDRYIGPVTFVRSTPPPNAIDPVGQVLTWTDLTQAGPNGFGRNLGPGESFVITTVFQIAAADEFFTMTNTAIVSDALDTYRNPANEDQDTERVINIPTAVGLLYFRVTPQQDAVLLEWETAVEIDNYGFSLLRSDTGNMDDADEIAFIPAAGYGRGSGVAYSYTDVTAQPGTAYTYWLVDIDTSGRRTVHGPVMVTPKPQLDLPYRIYLPIVIRN